MNADFLSRLNQRTGKRVALDDVRRFFFEVRPELSSSPVRNAELLAALKALEAAGQIQLPREGSWEKRGNPPLPNWIQLVREAPAKVREDFAAVAWVPEMGFWPELTPAARIAAKQINAFLLRRRGQFRMVPMKERSLEIFGDEKKLDSLQTGGMLFGGRLSLADIGAYVVPMPLAYRQADAPGRPLLILENLNSFHSFGEWNHEARRYSAVVYGAGQGFRSSGAALGQVLREVEGVGAEYLGDLDPTGVRIPLEFNAAAVPGSALLEPAQEFYSWLLMHGNRRERVEEQQTPVGLAQAWLGAKLGDALETMWRDGWWMPQEGLGLERLFKEPFLPVGGDASAYTEPGGGLSPDASIGLSSNA
ncbi:conserved hypothetical protein [Cupriavidus taiwanensis]|uniref:Wadjet protein JetD C-terminal domain-containing protein n=1 Tax=Cupriavidus taiwanensis TaxID=164546 RepID=A0A375EC54_9BURK|nr:Wadjet anti-phage system protein JetD domain-containing protein [Cupriavidus taiwanensis]SOZ68589.1 conserved hypothetical protein [Cupriavidus taiwanensis]SOZ69740.1 conserved hypothetical protein [Cupriavidus taiwanensis]SOZ72935.1 conserved hypothetical protein [Cupriavidus taiwanensis]SPA09792.1 conserved hypothetical protein [Cupriavidus taiwanensis]SPA23804.1 conserved hypothetical protein [Cupriavidus taiwanensis]